MKLAALLIEGRYDKLTGLITKRIMSYIKKTAKETSADKRSYRGYKIWWDERPTASRDTGYRVGLFNDPVSGLEVGVQVQLARIENYGKYMTDGYALRDEEDLQIVVFLDPAQEPKIYSSLLPEIKNTVRHELEHMTQKGGQVKKGKKRKFMWGARASYQIDPSKTWKYYMLADEVDANLQGLYKQAKTEKKPFQYIVDRWLSELMETGRVSLSQAKQIYRKMKKRAKEIGGLPPLG